MQRYPLGRKARSRSRTVSRLFQIKMENSHSRIWIRKIINCKSTAPSKPTRSSNTHPAEPYSSATPTEFIQLSHAAAKQTRSSSEFNRKHNSRTLLPSLRRSGYIYRMSEHITNRLSPEQNDRSEFWQNAHLYFDRVYQTMNLDAAWRTVLA